MSIHDTNPMVSVIMPAYNAESFIEAAMQSALAQSISDLELIVIDDGSRDRTREIIGNLAKQDKRIRFICNQENMGVARTRNKGIEQARGVYIAFLDSDDIWHPEKLERQLKKMEQYDAGIGYCAYGIIGANGEKARADYLVPEVASYDDILKENYIQCSAMIIRSDIVRKFMFNTEFFHEDYILGLDMLGSGEKAVGCKEILLYWRYLENSRSFNKKKAAMNRWRIYRDYLHLPLYKVVYLFTNYASAGLRKYLRKN